MEKIMDVVRDFVGTLREIDAKYKTPHIQMTPMVSLSLLLLRVYLLAMVAILLFKFVSTILVH
jgi:hypothetical protein